MPKKIAKKPAKKTVKTAKPTRRPPTNTAKMAAARKLQGKYLGLLRGLSGAKRAKVQAAAKKNGVAAALKLAKGL